MCGSIFEHYFNHILDGFPDMAFVVAGFYLIFVVSVASVGKKRTALFLLYLGYAMLLLYITVFSRSTEDQYKYNLIPFSSYFQIANGDKYLLPQVIMNIIMFFPVGFMTCLLRRERKWEMVVLSGVILSGLIEILQLLLKRGSAEIDDVIHNVIGCFVGYLLFYAVEKLYLLKRIY